MRRTKYATGTGFTTCNVSHCFDETMPQEQKRSHKPVTDEMELFNVLAMESHELPLEIIDIICKMVPSTIDYDIIENPIKPNADGYIDDDMLTHYWTVWGGLEICFDDTEVSEGMITSTRNVCLRGIATTVVLSTIFFGDKTFAFRNRLDWHVFSREKPTILYMKCFLQTCCTIYVDEKRVAIGTSGRATFLDDYNGYFIEDGSALMGIPNRVIKTKGDKYTSLHGVKLRSMNEYIYSGDFTELDQLLSA